MIRPYWADQTMLTGHRVGDAIDVVNNDQEYNVSVDVSQFEPEELKVNIVDNQLIIEGKHNEKTDKYGQVRVSLLLEKLKFCMKLVQLENVFMHP